VDRQRGEIRGEAVELSRASGKSGINNQNNRKRAPVTVSLRESITQISDPHSLDASVGEVFELMLGWRCRREEDPRVQEANSVTAVVGFGGVLSGACILRSGAQAALAIAARMTGAEFTEVDETVLDGIGEICNMLAGSWKGRFPELAAHCGLSIPAVIAGSDYNLRVQAPEFELRHTYRFENLSFEVMIVCDGLQ